MGSMDKHFHAIDVFVFTAMLGISAGVGIFFAYKDRRKQSTENYYFGGRKISPVPVALSLSLSFVSAITVIGFPVEVYLYGISFAWIVLAQFLGVCFTVVYFVPLYRRLQLNSIYEYLEMRFHRRVRLAVSLLGILDMTAYMGITIYLPALALSAVTPLSLHWTIALTSAVCTFYTAIGGVKAVIWTDVLQCAIMVAGMLTVIGRTVSVVGGFSDVVDTAERGGRMDFFRFDIDPRVRSGFWTLGLPYAVNEIYTRGCNQVCMQRYLCCRTTKSAQIALFLAYFPTAFYTLVAVACGLAMYAYYEGCDPLLAGQVEKNDQTMPRLAVEIFQDIPGMAGLFVSAAFCGTLSTLSSGINSLAALCLHDFVIPSFRTLDMRRRMLLNKTFSVCFGVIVMLIAYVISYSDSNIVQISFKALSAFGGPAMGVFILAAFMPWTNHQGALAGLVVSWALTSWVTIASLFIEAKHPTWEKLPLSADFCNVTEYGFNTTSSPDMLITGAWESVTSRHGAIPSTDRPLIYDTLYSISPFLYSTLGFLICVVVANVVSLITGVDKTSAANPELFLPLLTSKVVPAKVANFFRFGVPQSQALVDKKMGLETNGKNAEANVGSEDSRL